MHALLTSIPIFGHEGLSQVLQAAIGILLSPVT
jgi:hypothetical protein